MKKKLLILIYFFVLIIAVNAQPRFVPDEDIKKVGDVMFLQPKRVVFGFSNKGNQPLTINDVHPACGCTKVEFTQTPVEPGGRGEIVATYDAAFLGTFSKDLMVYTNETEDPYFLVLQGRVATTVSAYTGDFPIDLGNIRINTNYLEFDNVNRGDKPVTELLVMNTDRQAFRPELMHLPPYLTAEAFPEDIPSGKIGRIKITLDSEKLGTLGLTQTSVYIARYLGDKVGENNEIIISSVLLPDFSKLSSSDVAKAPHMTVSERDIVMGPVGKKKSISKAIIISNQGQTPLNIKQVQVFNRALGVALGDRTLASGKSTKLKITLNASFLKSAKARPRVLLVSDDPRNPMETVNITVTP